MFGGNIHSLILIVVNILTAFLGVCGYVWLKRDFKNVKSFFLRAHQQQMGGGGAGMIPTLTIIVFKVM